MHCVVTALLILVSTVPAAAQEIATGPSETFHGDVLSAESVDCGWGPQEPCTVLRIQPVTGSYTGSEITVTITPRSFLGGAKRLAFGPGDRVIVESQVVNGEPKFFVSDFVRTRSLAGLAFLFTLAVVLLGGWAAVRSLTGMILSFLILCGVMLPAILQGVSPVFVAIAGGGGIVVLTMLLSHGWHAKTFCAMAGTVGSLACTLLLSQLYTGWSKLSGLSDEEVLILFRENASMDTQGLLLAGIIVGTLGVLDDITISQASAVFELRAANPLLSARELYRRAIRIGSDHIAAAVNTLVLAYAGASLPLLLLVASAPEREGILTLLNREVFATEIVRTLVGSIGLLAAVPLTTWIASVAAIRWNGDPSAVAAHGHAH